MPVITPFTPKHLEAVAVLELQAGDVQWSRAQFEKELSLSISRFVVFVEGDAVWGYGGYWSVAGEAQITNLVIAPDHRRQGWGSQLLQHLLTEARREGCQRATLEVRIGNSTARTLYRHAGFRKTGLRARAYTNPPETAVLMEKVL